MDMKNTFLKTIKNIVKVLVVAGLTWLIFHVASETHLVSNISKIFSPKAENPSQAISKQIDSIDIQEQIKSNLLCNQYVMGKQLTLDVVDMSNKAGDYNTSLDELLFYTPKISECNKRSTASSSDYKYESLLYQKLAETLKLKGDTKRAELALIKSKAAKEMAAKFLVEEKKQQEKELDKILVDTTIKK